MYIWEITIKGLVWHTLDITIDSIKNLFRKHIHTCIVEKYYIRLVWSYIDIPLIHIKNLVQKTYIYMIVEEITI